MKIKIVSDISIRNKKVGFAFKLIGTETLTFKGSYRFPTVDTTAAEVYTSRLAIATALSLYPGITSMVVFTDVGPKPAKLFNTPKLYAQLKSQGIHFTLCPIQTAPKYKPFYNQCHCLSRNSAL